jgi:flagellar biosynthesis/type III secretory pathway chaperone
MLSPASADPGPAANAAVFAAGLQAERDALGAFISLLQAEQEVLIDGDAERLAALTPDKAAQIDLFTLLGEQRRRHLAAQNLTDSADGMVTWLSRNHGFAAAVRKIWQELLARAESARQLNQNNGLLIESRLQQNRLKLAVLQTAAAADAVYRPDGQFGPLRSTRSFSRV